MKGWVGLNSLRFFAYHGFYENERAEGNHFTIDIKVFTDFSKAAEDDNLEGTVNYEEIYKICKEVMEGSEKLLEHLSFKIISRLKSEIVGVEKVDVIIRKENPPIEGDCKESFVHITD